MRFLSAPPAYPGEHTSCGFTSRALAPAAPRHWPPLSPGLQTHVTVHCFGAIECSIRLAIPAVIRVNPAPLGE